MPNYFAEIPVVINLSQRNDRLGFRTSWGVRVDGELIWRDLRCRLTSQEDGTVRATFDEVPATSQGEAYAMVCEALGLLVPLVSLEIQREHMNRHYGPLRATWSRTDVRIAPSDDWPSASVAMRAVRTVAITRTNDYLAVIAANPELRPLLLSYDRALEPDDDETRFFNAFAIVEFIEGRFATPARFTALLDDAGAAAVLAATQTCGRALSLTSDVMERLGSLLNGPLRRGTVEGRDAKLVAVLRTDFCITRVEDALGQVEVDLGLVRKLTAARNRLFHGKDGGAADFARLTDHLTLIVEQILRALLERRVAVPSPSR